MTAPRTENTNRGGQEPSRLFVLAVVDQNSGRALRVPTDSEIARLQSLYSVGECQNSLGCFYCGVEKTPQWRKGPQTAWGPAKLCNACGTRYLRSMRKLEQGHVMKPDIPTSVRSSRTDARNVQEYVMA